MRRFQNILYVTRGVDAPDSHEIEALKQALSLARNNEAALHASIVTPQLPKQFADLKGGLETSLREKVKLAIESAAQAVKVNLHQVELSLDVDAADTPGIHIVRRVLRNAHDLVIKQVEDTKLLTGFRALDMQLLRQCPCPLWLSRPIHRSRQNIRVAVAIDPSQQQPVGRDLSIQLLRLARSLADTCSGELHILSCWEFPLEEACRKNPWVKLASDVVDAAVDATRTDHRKSLDALIAQSEIAGRSVTHHHRGPPADSIPQLVDELGIDILVMGTVARVGIGGFIIGNTAENILSRVKCSLVALKPNGFISPVRPY